MLQGYPVTRFGTLIALIHASSFHHHTCFLPPTPHGPFDIFSAHHTTSPLLTTAFLFGLVRMYYSSTILISNTFVPPTQLGTSRSRLFACKTYQATSRLVVWWRLRYCCVFTAPEDWVHCYTTRVPRTSYYVKENTTGFSHTGGPALSRPLLEGRTSVCMHPICKLVNQSSDRTDLPPRPLQGGNEAINLRIIFFIYFGSQLIRCINWFPYDGTHSPRQPNRLFGKHGVSEEEQFWCLL